MIRHIVMFKFKDSANGRSKEENLQEAKARMLALGEEIPEFTRFTVSFWAGWQAPGNYDYILVSEFDSLEQLTAYQKHPAHVEAAGYVKSVTCNRTCFDYCG